MSEDDWTAGIDALLVTECARCDRRWYLPHDRCPRCGATEHRRRSGAGTGTAVAVTVVRPAPPGDRPAPFGICLVDLDDGVRVLGRAAPTLQVGERVRVTWENHQPVFASVDPAG